MISEAGIVLAAGVHHRSYQRASATTTRSIMGSQLPPKAGYVQLNCSGRRYGALYWVADGILTIQSPLGDAKVALPDAELVSASVARTVLKQLVSRRIDAENG